MKKVMIIEDDEAINDILCIILRNRGFEVISKDHGELVSYSSQERPDLFVIDKNLPGVDGISICNELKSNPDTREIPVIMISANHHFIPAALDAGADAFIEKPFSRDELIAKIEQFCNPMDQF